MSDGSPFPGGKLREVKRGGVDEADMVHRDRRSSAVAHEADLRELLARARADLEVLHSRYLTLEQRLHVVPAIVGELDEVRAQLEAERDRHSSAVAHEADLRELLARARADLEVLHSRYLTLEQRLHRARLDLTDARRQPVRQHGRFVSFILALAGER